MDLDSVGSVSTWNLNVDLKLYLRVVCYVLDTCLGGTFVDKLFLENLLLGSFEVVGLYG